MSRVTASKKVYDAVVQAVVWYENIPPLLIRSLGDRAHENIREKINDACELDANDGCYINSMEVVDGKLYAVVGDDCGEDVRVEVKIEE